ncbi:MAG TPA: 3-hydroxyacyl-CoA dehydrogenase family protein [Chitinophagaceae bacterium]|nr:3-hydroxyacyl-CoA dehydrogenase family protein [Chitinophagaceae bacterium]
MKVKVWGSADRVAELLEKGLGSSDVIVNGREGPGDTDGYDLFIDLNFDEAGPAGPGWIPRIGARPVLLNTICTSLSEIQSGESLLFGFNSWPTFINRSLAEITAPVKEHLAELDKIMNQLDWKYVIVEDRAGMATPRIAAMIINEAYFTAGDGTATREDIDAAMKLGTRYPYGPFEWGERIGKSAICRLLEKLHRDTGDDRYLVAPLLKSASRSITDC